MQKHGNSLLPLPLQTLPSISTTWTRVSCDFLTSSHTCTTLSFPFLLARLSCTVSETRHAWATSGTRPMPHAHRSRCMDWTDDVGRAGKAGQGLAVGQGRRGWQVVVDKADQVSTNRKNTASICTEGFFYSQVSIRGKVFIRRPLGHFSMLAENWFIRTLGSLYFTFRSRLPELNFFSF